MYGWICEFPTLQIENIPSNLNRSSQCVFCGSLSIPKDFQTIQDIQIVFIIIIKCYLSSFSLDIYTNDG